jgi:hypothetical protein
VHAAEVDKRRVNHHNLSVKVKHTTSKPAPSPTKAKKPRTKTTTSVKPAASAKPTSTVQETLLSVRSGRHACLRDVMGTTQYNNYTYASTPSQFYKLWRGKCVE